MQLGLAQQKDDVLWQRENRLEWSDFKGKPSRTSNASAVTASGIAYSFSTFRKNDKIEIDFQVTSYFYPQNSWVRNTITDTLILNHEQLHFDITEIYTRKLRREFAEATFSDNVKAEVKAIYEQIIKELNDFQNLYDKETNFSRNYEKQLEWNKQVSMALEQH